MIVPHYYEDPHILHENTMPNRAYFIPASRRRDDLVEHRENSDRFQLLNGDWRFRYYHSIYDLQEPFYQPGYDLTDYDTTPVPGVWQNHGYDHHQYTNIRYPFPADPPYVPKDNPCGAYICDFVYHQDEIAPCSFLNFEGVASCFYVWLNGNYVGYSQVSHSTSEFDVTRLLHNGSNHLAVLVLKWCDGSYMSDLYDMAFEMPVEGASYPILCTPGEDGCTLYAPDFPNLQITAPTMDAGLLEMKEKLHKALRQYKYPPTPTRQEQIVVPATGFLLLIRVA